MRVLVLAVLVFGAIATSDEEDEDASESAECPDLADGCTACADVMDKCNGGLGEEDEDFEVAEDDVDGCAAATAAVEDAIAAAQTPAAVFACTPAVDAGNGDAALSTEELCVAFWATPADGQGEWTAAVEAVDESCTGATTAGAGLAACGAGNNEACTADNCNGDADDCGDGNDEACTYEAGSAGNAESCDPVEDDQDTPVALDTEVLCVSYWETTGEGQGVWAEVVAAEGGNRRRLACDEACLEEFVGDCSVEDAIECIAQWTEFGEDCEDTWAAGADDAESPAAMLSLGAAVLLMFL